MSQNLFINDYPVVPKAITSDLVPPEIVKDVARNASLQSVREATVRLAQAKRQADLEQTNRIIAYNNSVEHKAVEGLGEKQATIPLSVFFEMKRRCGDDYWNHQSNIDEFLKTNPQYKIKISRGTRGQAYEGKG